MLSPGERHEQDSRYDPISRHNSGNNQVMMLERSHFEWDGLNRGPKDRGPGTEDQGPIVLIHQSSCVHAFFLFN